MAETREIVGKDREQDRGDDYVGQQRAVDTRRTILMEAARLFADKGFDGCSTRDVATAAGVSHANIRYHFGDKETLWLKVIKFLIAESKFGDQFTAEITSSDNPVEVYRQHTRRVITFVANNPELPRIIHFEAMTNSPRYKKVQGLMAEVDAERIGHVKAMQKSGVVDPNIDPHQLHAFIRGALINIFVVDPDIRGLSKPKKDALIEKYTDLILSFVVR